MESIDKQEDKEQPTFEIKVKNAQGFLDKLVDPQITLSKSVEYYKEGLKELQEAQKLLDEAKFEFQELSER